MINLCWAQKTKKICVFFVHSFIIIFGENKYFEKKHIISPHVIKGIVLRPSTRASFIFASLSRHEF